MTEPIGTAIVLASGCSPTSTGTPINIASVIIINIIIVSRDLSLPADHRVYGVFGPRLAGLYEQDMTLIFLADLTEVLLVEIAGVV